MATPAEIASPALKVRFIQAAKEGKLDLLKKYVQDEIINFLIFNGADLDLHAKDGNTALHLASTKGKLNAAHLLIEAKANPRVLNELRQRPIDLCGKNAPMAALLRDNGDPKVRERGIPAEEEHGEGDCDEVVLAAAKDLVESTLDKVTAREEMLVLACEKVVNDAEKVETVESDDYAEIQKALAAHRTVSDAFKDVVSQVTQYKDQLGLNRRNVSNMCGTLAETQKDVMTKLQLKRTGTVATRDQVGELEQGLTDMTEEHARVSAEAVELQARLDVLLKRKTELTSSIATTRQQIERLSASNMVETKNENAIAVHQEALQATRTQIDAGDDTLNKLQDTTTQRLLKASVDYSTFLRKYMKFVEELIEQFQYKVRTMGERIDDETRNYEEVKKLHLKMDASKLTALVEEYKANLARFERRRDKIIAIADSIRKDFQSVRDLIGGFGREIDPLE